MADAQTEGLKKPLRLWPGVVIVVLQWLSRFVIPIVFPDVMEYGVMGALLGGVLVIVWWAFFSRAPRFERWGAVVVMVVALVATPLILHESIATGMMGLMFLLYAIPVLSMTFVVWAVVGQRLADGPRRIAMVVAIFLACGMWALFKTGGFTSDMDQDFSWRWAETPEDRLVAQEGDKPMVPHSALEIAETGVAWPGFRGSDRDGIVRGVQIETDWSTSPPVELWRRPIGPGWSSFAARGDVFYTQEQRGDYEVVACYNVTTGEPMWRHRDKARFWEANAGAGPRGTPTLSGDRVYTFGATGILNALNATDGTVVWSRNAASDTDAKLPDWAFSSSPLVVDDLVIVATSGSLVAYDRDTGEPRWFGPAAGTSYSSPHLSTIDGVAQILQLNGDGIVSVQSADGKVLWQHEWSGYPIVQPAVTSDGDVLISVSDRGGLRRIGITHELGKWAAEERWTSIGLKPYFSDFVIHEGHAYGVDGRILSCINIDDGKRKWKGGRYGSGQLVLLADQGLLLVLSEKGELALVKAAPDKFIELGRVSAIEGKTWNHPVLVGDVLLVRNAHEMAAFRLSLEGS